MFFGGFNYHCCNVFCARKWTIRTVILVTLTADTFEIETAEKNVQKKYNILKDSIKTILKGKAVDQEYLC